MDTPNSGPYHRHIDISSTRARESPPGSSNSSPQTMVPPQPTQFAIAPASRAPMLSAPLPQIGSRSPGGFTPGPYSHSYGTSPTSPSTASGSLQDAQANDA